MGRIYIRGDVHGDFSWVKQFCEQEETTRQDLMILTGDSGLLFYGKDNSREKFMKTVCGNAPLTWLVVRGNHDNRPANEGMELRYRDFIKGQAYWEDEYYNIIYAAEIGEYSINLRKFLTIGGAYSVDKFYRIHNHWTWYADEELTDEEMNEGLHKVRGRKYDYIVSHTCPINMEPTWLFMNGIDQSQVSKRMEKFLQRIKNCVNYSCWFWGHYHDDHQWRRLDWETPPTEDDPAHIMLMKNIMLIEEPNHPSNESYLDTGIEKIIELENE